MIKKIKNMIANKLLRVCYQVPTSELPRGGNQLNSKFSQILQIKLSRIIEGFI